MIRHRWLALTTWSVCVWPVVAAQAMGAAPTDVETDAAPRGAAIEMVSTGQSELAVLVGVPDGYELTEGAPLSYAVRAEGGRLAFAPSEGRLDDARQMPLIIRARAERPGRDTVLFEATVPYCTMGEPKLCKLQRVSARQLVLIEPGGATRWSVPVMVEERIGDGRSRE